MRSSTLVSSSSLVCLRMFSVRVSYAVLRLQAGRRAMAEQSAAANSSDWFSLLVRGVNL